MKKFLLLLFVGIMATVHCAAENFTDDLIPQVVAGDLEPSSSQSRNFQYIAGSGTEYDFTCIYAGLNGEYKLNFNRNKTGALLVTKTFGTIKRITIDWSGGGATSALALYGSDTPYADAVASYAESTCGTLLATEPKGDSGAFTQVLEVASGTAYKYYALRVADGAAVAAIVKALHIEYEPAEMAMCGLISVSKPDGTDISGTAVTLDEPMELTISCATEGAAIGYTYNGDSGTIDGNPGKFPVERGGVLTLTATKDGYEPNTRALEISIPVKPVEVKAAAKVVDGNVIRAYGKTTVVLSTSTPGAEIAWTYGDATGTTAELEVEADGTLSVTASKDGFISATRTIDVRALDPLTSIQNVWNAYPVEGSGVVTDAEPFEVLFDATVVYAANVEGNGLVYITDGVNFSRICCDGAVVDLAPGDVIAAGWAAKFRNNGGWKEFVAQSVPVASSHDGVVPEALAVADGASLEALDPGTPVVVRKATIDVATPAEVYTGDEWVKQIHPKDADGREMLAMVNAFGLPSQQPGVYDIYGVVDFLGYKRNNAPAVGPTDGDYSHRRWRVAPTLYEQWLPTAPRPRFGHGDGELLAAGTPIEITCQDTEASIMYSIDGGDYALYDESSKPLMPERDIVVSAIARRDGYHDSEARTISLRYDASAGICDVAVGEAEAVFYDLQGVRVERPRAGSLYIRVSADGRAEKVLVK